VGAGEVVERTARDGYGRLLAYLARGARDLAAAEDALADAFRAAIETWPHDGAPAKPEAWLLTTARRKLIDQARHARVESDTLPTLIALADAAYELASTAAEFPDHRLQLLFVCAHPAIDASIRTPLMLQVVLGLDATRIASAFVVKPSAMGQRLSRAKARIRELGVRFELPEPADLPERLDAVLEAIYGAYGSGWDDVAGADPRRRGLSVEALYLGRVLAELMPEQAEVHGVLALMLHCEARRAARRSSDGAYVPLSDQDPADWSRQLIGEAEQHLYRASRLGGIGRFQLEAAIQSAHAQRASWETIALLYEGLVRVAPTLGALVGRAAALAEARGAAEGLRALRELSAEAYQPYWALKAHLLERLGDHAEAADAYERAIGLCQDPATRAFLLERYSRIAPAVRPATR
jgi:predicted RNA polymerase sigma factor